MSEIVAFKVRAVAEGACRMLAEGGGCCGQEGFCHPARCDQDMESPIPADDDMMEPRPPSRSLRGRGRHGEPS
ncbi:MAG: hypothetical protein JWP57_4390 [Spirosoma sp.]|nr:hypothetical protein [Spirosoma sp.]